MTASVKQTLDDARGSMAGFAENMEALKRNFLLRGFFNGRGYFDLAQLSTADYRQGALTKGSDRRLARVASIRCLVGARAELPGKGAVDRRGQGRRGLGDRALPENAVLGIVMVEGYAQQGPRDERYLRSRARASIVRDYLIGTFHLDPQATGAMPLSADSTDSPGRCRGTAWPSRSSSRKTPSAAR